MIFLEYVSDDDIVLLPKLQWLLVLGRSPKSSRLDFSYVWSLIPHYPTLQTFNSLTFQHLLSSAMTWTLQPLRLCPVCVWHIFTSFNLGLVLPHWGLCLIIFQVSSQASLLSGSHPLIPPLNSWSVPLLSILIAPQLPGAGDYWNTPSCNVYLPLPD